MLGPIVNGVAIILCATLGLFIKGIGKYERTIVNALALSVMLFGISGAVGGLLDESSNVLLFIVSLVVGAIIGDKLRIDYWFKQLGDFLGSKFGDTGNFSKGFVTASLIYCIGAMAIIGSFESGLTGNHEILFAKSILDGVMSIVLASTMGIGVVFSGFAVLIYEGGLALMSGLLSPIITDDSIRELSTVGNALIVAIGLDMLGIVKINYANMLPAVVIPLIFYAPQVNNIIDSFMGMF